MKKFSWLLGLLGLLFLIATGCATGRGNSTNAPVAKSSTELTISAAASLKDSLLEIQQAYAKVDPDIKLTYNFAGSGTLQQQIEQGAPVDLFISAGKSQVDALQGKNLLIEGTRVDLLGNDLVLAVNKVNTSISSLQDLTKSSITRIAIGTPESVPAGKYAQDALTTVQLYDTLKSKLVLAKDVTQVLNYIETGNVDAGFVYRSDAQGSSKVKIATVVPANSHQPIVYPAAIIAGTRHQAQAAAFLTFLQGSEAQKIFARYGFLNLNK